VPQQKLVDQIRNAIRVKLYSPRTDEASWNWIKRFIIFHGKRQPNDMAESESARFSPTSKSTRESVPQPGIKL